MLTMSQVQAFLALDQDQVTVWKHTGSYPVPDSERHWPPSDGVYEIQEHPSLILYDPTSDDYAPPTLFLDWKRDSHWLKSADARCPSLAVLHCGFTWRGRAIASGVAAPFAPISPAAKAAPRQSYEEIHDDDC